MSINPIPPNSSAITQLTGDVAAGPGVGSQVATIPNDTVTYAKIQNVSAADRLLGRGNGGGSGDIQELTLGANLAMSGTVLNTVGGSGGTGNITTTSAEGSEPGSPNTGDLYFPNNGFYVRRYSGSLWVPWGPLFPMTEPISSDFAWINQGGATITTTNGGVYLLAPKTSGNSVRARVKSAPGTPYTVTIGFIPQIVVGASANNCGMVLRQSSDGKLLTWGLNGTASPPTNDGIKLFSWTSATVFSAQVTAKQIYNTNNLIWLRMTDNGTNRLYSWSADGQNFIQLYSETRTTFLTADQIGFFANESANVSDVGITVLSWIQA